MRYDITAIYSILDDFSKTYKEYEKTKLIDTDRKRYREGKLTLSEMLTIVVCYHFEGYKDFKNYYLSGVCCKPCHCQRKCPPLC